MRSPSATPTRRHPVPDGKTAQPLLYHGEPVLSRRVDSALEAIARRTDGSIVRLGLASGDLGTLYQTKIEPAARRRRESTRLADRAERFPLFLFAALTFLVAALLAGQPRMGLAVDMALELELAAFAAKTWSGRALAHRWPAWRPGPAMRRRRSDRSRRPGRRAGQAAYGPGRWDQALAAFEAAIQRAPASAVPRYNAAATLFQLGRYDEARQLYLEARERAEPFLRTKIDYALGNTALAEGDIPGAIRSYDECVASTARGAALEAVRRDAAINRRFALEQPQSLAVPQDNNSGDQSKSQNPDRRRGPNRQGNGDDQSPEGEPESDPGKRRLEPGGAGGSRPSPLGRRRMGGAGGGRTAPPGARGDTPDDRLDAALEHIRAAQKRRLPDEDPPASANDDRKDW